MQSREGEEKELATVGLDCQGSKRQQIFRRMDGVKAVAYKWSAALK